MAQSYTGGINTNNEFQKVSELTNLIFTSGKKFNIQVQNTAYLKTGNAIFCFNNEKFSYVAGEDELYIKTPFTSCTLTIMEVE